MMLLLVAVAPPSTRKFPSMPVQSCDILTVGIRIIGEDKTLSVKVGAEAGGDSEDVIVVRGIRVDVDRAVKEIKKIVEDAQNDEIVSSYVSHPLQRSMRF